MRKLGVVVMVIICAFFVGCAVAWAANEEAEPTETQEVLTDDIDILDEADEDLFSDFDEVFEENLDELFVEEFVEDDVEEEDVIPPALAEEVADDIIGGEELIEESVESLIKN